MHIQAYTHMHTKSHTQTALTSTHVEGSCLLWNNKLHIWQTPLKKLYWTLMFLPEALRTLLVPVFGNHKGQDNPFSLINDMPWQIYSRSTLLWCLFHLFPSLNPAPFSQILSQSIFQTVVSVPQLNYHQFFKEWINDMYTLWPVTATQPPVNKAQSQGPLCCSVIFRGSKFRLSWNIHLWRVASQAVVHLQKRSLFWWKTRRPLGC